MDYILFDDSSRNNLLPFTFTRPVADIRIGIFTIREKWEIYLGKKTFTLTQDYLQKKHTSSSSKNLVFINGSVFPDTDLHGKINLLKNNQALYYKDVLIALRSNKPIAKINDLKGFVKTEYKENILKINSVWDIFSKNGEAIQQDFNLITKGRKSQSISKTNVIIGNPKNIFIEDGVKMECAVLNANDGVIYIGRNAEIMEGSMVRGGLALCEHSVLKMGTKIYGATTIGPHSKVGGEINNSVIFGYSNKAHDGFLGNSVIGEWCNLGADTNNSNLKNNYSDVKIWNYDSADFVNTHLQFCGLIMGDHSKCGINTMFNTGTVVGVGANIFGAGFPEKFIPDFSWGGADGFSTYQLDKAFEVAEKVWERRGKKFDKTEKDILKKVFSLTSKYRK